MSTATVAPAGTWNVDPSHSKVAFAVKHLGIATVRGEFGDFAGTLEIGEDVAASRAYGTVRTASVDTNDAGRDEHLRGADFFDAEVNPEIAFESTSIEPTGDGALRITGRLTINGVTNEETFDAEIAGTASDPWGNERVGLEVSGQISRSDYGVKFGLAAGTGNALVADKVRITLDISAVKSS